MSFKNLKLGIKLAIGFGSLIAISLALGIIAIVNMNKITTQSKTLAKEYIPELKISMDLRGAANRATYEMRAYGYTQDETFYDRALREIKVLENALEKGMELNNSAKHLIKLKEQLQIIRQAKEKYIDLIRKTAEINKTLEKDRELMDVSAKKYMNTCNNYLAEQNSFLSKEIQIGNTNSSRLAKVTLINNIINYANTARIGNFKSQALRDLNMFRETLSIFPNIFEELKKLQKYNRTAKNSETLNIIEEQAKNYQAAMNSFFKNWKKTEELTSEIETAANEVITACITTAEDGMSGTQTVANNAISLLNASNTILTIGLILALIIGISFSFFLTKLIVNPMVNSVDFAEKISEGRLSASLSIEREDEIGDFAKAMNKMRNKLNEIVEEIMTAANSIAGASVQLSESTTEQASSTEEVSSSMEEMTSNILQNTDNARETEKIASRAASDIEEGYKSVETTVNAMVEIAEKISIIEEIAEKTDLLAINAAIEAARAGEHGKGFAVVAVEVRKLAERSQAAAAEINKVSSSSVDIAKKSGQLMKEIVPDIQKTTRLVQEIAASSLEQNSGADQINNSITQLNQMNQQNASSAEELASMAEQLTDLISFFDVNKSQSTYSAKKIDMPIASENRPAKKERKEFSGVKIKIDDTIDKGYDEF